MPADILTQRNGADVAVFSPCERYRYSLRRRIGEGDRAVVCVMLNPSRADAFHNDPTVARCCRYAERWGFGWMEVVNIFGLRSTDPRGLRDVEDPVGPGNQQAILDAVRRADLVVCGWGVHGAYRDRGRDVAALIRRHTVPHVLGLTRDGHPRHPLYMRADLDPVRWEA